MLPSILEIAKQHGLEMNGRCSSRSAKEVRFKCPFCETDANRKGKYYLSLNTTDNLFKCWACGEAGGVLKFIALLDHTSIEEVKRNLWGDSKSPRKPLHPAEKLTPAQLKAIGFVGPSWGKLKKSNPAYYQRTLDWVWAEWQKHVWLVKRSAYRRFLLSKTTDEIKAAIYKCAVEISEKSDNLLLEFTSAKFSANKPEWAKDAEEWFAIAM